MFDVGHKEGPRPKCYFTHSVLPGFVYHEQPSQKKRPFCTIQEHSYVHTLDLLLPTAISTDFLDKLKTKESLQYSKVYMNLSDLLEGDFFNDYIKTGDILMLSEGRPGLDNIFALHSGILRLELDKASYQHTVLSGVAIPSEGRKHVKARYAVEINLRLPSLVRGKHGFERIVWAFKNVLNERKTWLFYDLKGANDGTGAVGAHQPIVRAAEPEVGGLGEVVVPAFPEEVEEGDSQTPVEVLEWLGLTLSRSPRVRKGDAIDSYLSRYCLLDAGGGAETKAQELSRIRWRGFIPANFVQTVAIMAMKATGNDWFALSSRSFDGKTHSFIQHGHNTLSWEFGD